MPVGFEMNILNLYYPLKKTHFRDEFRIPSGSNTMKSWLLFGQAK